MGTHVVTRFTLGGRFGIQFQSTKAQYKDMLERYGNKGFEIGAQIGLFGGGIKPSARNSEETRKEVSNFYSSQVII